MSAHFILCASKYFFQNNVDFFIALNKMIFSVAPGIMNNNNNPTILNWNIETILYHNKPTKTEYPYRVFNYAYRDGLHFMMHLSRKDLNYMCRWRGIGFEVI